MKYIDVDGTEREISEAVEKQFKEENQKWIKVEYFIIMIVFFGIVFGLVDLYNSLPK